MRKPFGKHSHYCLENCSSGIFALFCKIKNSCSFWQMFEAKKFQFCRSTCPFLLPLYKVKLKSFRYDLSCTFLSPTKLCWYKVSHIQYSTHTMIQNHLMYWKRSQWKNHPFLTHVTIAGRPYLCVLVELHGALNFVKENVAVGSKCKLMYLSIRGNVDL